MEDRTNKKSFGISREAILIIEAFECFLDKKGVAIPNAEKIEAARFVDNPGEIKNIYGSDLANLLELVKDVLKEFPTVGKDSAIDYLENIGWIRDHDEQVIREALLDLESQREMD